MQPRQAVSVCINLFTAILSTWYVDGITLHGDNGPTRALDSVTTLRVRIRKSSYGTRAEKREEIRR